jgi:hypothetical protein
LITINHSCE